MNITMIPLSELTPNPRNVRLHSAKQSEEYRRSVEKFGQTKAIVCDENKTILIGNGLYEAMKTAGLSEAACFIKTGMSENDKLKMMMADNKVYSLGVDNLETIEDIIAELGAVKDFDIPGYDADLLETLTFEPIKADDFMGGYGILDTDTKAEMGRAAVKYEEEEAEFAASAEEISGASALPGIEAQQSGFDAEKEGGGSGGGAFPAPSETGEAERSELRPTLQRRFLVCPKCGEKIWL